MLDSSAILQLFGNVLNKDIDHYKISELDIRKAVYNMAKVYAPQPANLQLTIVNVANYNDVAHRCAYLHKYAAFHTAMVQDIMFMILEQRWNLFKTITSSDEFRICSLGGGPGNDVLGVIAALNTLFCTFKVHVTVVDLMEKWKFTFASVIEELSTGNYGTLQTSVSDNFLKWNYIGADLLGTMANPVKLAISEASLVILVKFVSAAACKRTEKMIERIFRSMQPGALLLFIDNAGGGFRQMIKKAANKYTCNTVFGPLNHNHYCKESLKSKRFGYASCFETTVTVHLLQKSKKQQRRKFSDYMSVSSDSENYNISSDPTRVTKPISDKKINSHSNSSLSHNYYGLHQNANLPGYDNNGSLSSHQQNAKMFSDLTLTPKSVSAKNIDDYSNLSTSHNNPRLAQRASLPANVTKDYIPVPSDQKNTSIFRDVTLIGNFVSKKKIHPQTDSSRAHNTPLFQDVVPVNFPVSANTASTSQNIINFNKSINSPKNNPNKSDLPNNHLKAAPTSVGSSRSHNTPLFQDVVPVNYPSCANTASTSQNISNFNKSISSPKITSIKSNLPNKHLKAAPTSADSSRSYNTPLFQDVVPVNSPGYANTSSTSQNISNFNKFINSPKINPNKSNLPNNHLKDAPTSVDSSRSHNTPLFQDVVPDNLPSCANTASTSQTIRNFNKSISSPKITPIKSNLPNKHLKAAAISVSSVLRDNISVTKSNHNTSPGIPNDNHRSLKAHSTDSNRTSSSALPQSQSNAFPEPEDNSDTCCSCCVIS